MKYRIEEAGRRLTVSLTPLGRLREFLGGSLAVLPWTVAGLAVFFLPDYLGKYRHSEEMLPTFWAYLGVLLAIVVLGAGLSRALRPVQWEFGAGMVREHHRTLFGRAEVRVEAPSASIAEVNFEGGAVKLATVSGGASVVARAWFGQAELETLTQKIRAAVGVSGK